MNLFGNEFCVFCNVIIPKTLIKIWITEVNNFIKANNITEDL